MTIYPTGTCFDDVLDHQSWWVKVDQAAVLRQYIVHGICLAPEGSEAGTPFAHAWVEDDTENKVYQAGIANGEKIWYGMDRSEWYALMRVQERTRYPFALALMKNWQSNHFGPWVEKYRALCGGRRIFQ